LTTLDERLLCNCGELGEVKAVTAAEEGGSAGFRVFCKRDGAPCCMTRRGDTPEQAIENWVAMNQEAGQ